MQPHLSLVTLGVRDLPTARRFYVEGLGWEPFLDLDEIVFIQIGHGLLFGLFPATGLDADVDPALAPSGPASAAPFALAHNVDSEAEVDAAVARAAAAGATVLKRPQHADFGGYHAYVADPDGFRWEIAHNPGFAVDPDGTVRLVTPEP
ncbi:MAG: glyoxalase [Acidimicrobiales bacterium]|nr:glyoxalase [Acidimicrobiales bacterium]